jgi:ABC-type branched-subunit amino acid transport system substrate-binding protein
LVAIHLRRLGIDVTLLGGDSWTNDRLFFRGLPTRPAYHTDHWSPAADDPFVTRFRERFGERPQGGRAALAHDAVSTLAAALAACGPLTAERLGGDGLRALRVRLRDALASIRVRGVTGPIRFDPNGDALKPCFVFRIDDRGRHPFATVE